MVAGLHLRDTHLLQFASYLRAVIKAVAASLCLGLKWVAFVIMLGLPGRLVAHRQRPDPFATCILHLEAHRTSFRTD
jgi:hypothetical protein